MNFFKAKPTATQVDRDYIHDSFKFFEKIIGKKKMTSSSIVLPTKDFFSRSYTGVRENVLDTIAVAKKQLGIESIIELELFKGDSINFTDEGVYLQSEEDQTENENQPIVFTDVKVDGTIILELDRLLLGDMYSMMAAVFYELSMLQLSNHVEWDENAGILIELFAIANGFGIFICNALAGTQQWSGISHQGWSVSKGGFMPEPFAAYALAYFNEYKNSDTDWDKYLGKSFRKSFRKNLKYLKTQM